MGVLVVGNKAINMAYIREVEAVPASSRVRVTLRDSSGRKVAEYITRVDGDSHKVCKELLRIVKDLFYSNRSAEIEAVVRTARERVRRNGVERNTCRVRA